jgi:K+-transporting ATPase A subunit
MHDSLQPLSGLVPLVGMFINSAFGGVGVGVINLIVYLIWRCLWRVCSSGARRSCSGERWR